MKKVVGYIRVSTDGQTGDDKFGMEAQEKQIRDYCKDNDLELTKIYCDAGKSGAKDDRPELDKILYGIVQNPPIEAVVVAASDRIARKIELYYYYEFILQQKGVDLISVKEDFGSMGEFAPIMKSLVVAMAQMERNNINRRTSSGRMVKASKGGYSGGKTPFGYKAVDGQLVINLEEADTVRKVYDLRNLGYMPSKIASELSKLGKTCRKGTPITVDVVRGILRNERVYRGEYKYGKHGEWTKGKQPPILY